MEERHSLLVVALADIDFVDIAVLAEDLRNRCFDHNLLAVARTAVVDCSPPVADNLRDFVDCSLPAADIHPVGNRHMLLVEK